MKTTIENIIGMFAYTKNGHKIPAPSIKGNPVTGALIQEANGTWSVIGKDEVDCNT